MLGDADRPAREEEDGAGAEAKHERRVLPESLPDVQRVTQLVGRALELGALSVDG